MLGILVCPPCFSIQVSEWSSGQNPYKQTLGHDFVSRERHFGSILVFFPLKLRIQNPKIPPPLSLFMSLLFGLILGLPSQITTRTHRQNLHLHTIPLGSHFLLTPAPGLRHRQRCIILSQSCLRPQLEVTALQQHRLQRSFSHSHIGPSQLTAAPHVGDSCSEAHDSSSDAQQRSSG